MHAHAHMLAQAHWGHGREGNRAKKKNWDPELGRGGGSVSPPTQERRAILGLKEGRRDGREERRRERKKEEGEREGEDSGEWSYDTQS